MKKYVVRFALLLLFILLIEFIQSTWYHLYLNPRISVFDYFLGIQTRILMRILPLFNLLIDPTSIRRADPNFLQKIKRLQDEQLVNIRMGDFFYGSKNAKDCRSQVSCTEERIFISQNNVKKNNGRNVSVVVLTNRKSIVGKKKRILVYLHGGILSIFVFF